MKWDSNHYYPVVTRTKHARESDIQLQEAFLLQNFEEND